MENGTNGSLTLLHRAIDALPIRSLWRKLNLLGDPPARDNVKFSSPLRQDQHPSCTISDEKLHDWSRDEHLDSYDVFQRVKGLNSKDAFRPFVDLAGLGHELNGQKPKPIPNSPQSTLFDWSNYITNVSESDLEELSQWRGLSLPFCRWLRDQKLIGRDKEGQWVFPVQYQERIVAAHIRRNEPNQKGNHDWLYVPRLSELQIGVQPLATGRLVDAKGRVFAGESQWDMFSILDRLGIHDGEEIAAIATRGANNVGLLKDAEGEIYLVPQNDQAGKNWLDGATKEIGRAVRILEVPTEHNDANDWLRACADARPLVTAIQNAKIVNEQETPWSEALSIGGCSSLALSTIEIKPRKPLIDDWCRDGDLGFIFAKRGIGKTMLGMHLAKGLAIKHDVGPWKIHEQRKVLYLDGEMPAPDIKLRDYVLGDRTENLVYVNHEILFERTGKIINLANVDFQRSTLEFCQAKAFRVLFLDNLSTLTSGVKENDSMDWEIIQPWLLRLRRAHITVFFIHHAGRWPDPGKVDS